MKVRLKIQLLDKAKSEGAFNSKPNYVDLVNLVRSIQRAEGHLDCYRRDRRQCGRMDCVWRDHCLKAPAGSSKVENESRQPQKAANWRQDQDRLH